MDIEKLRLVAKKGSLVGPCLKAAPKLSKEVVERLEKLERYNFNFLLLGLSPKRILREGRLFDNEQVLPMILFYAQWDKHCRFWATEIVRQWLFFNPANGDFEEGDEARIDAFRDYFFKTYAMPLIEEFRRFVALTMIYPDRSNAPPGPVDMVWHSFMLCTDRYWQFGKEVWVGAQHVPPDVKEEWLKGAPSPHTSGEAKPKRGNKKKPKAQ